MGIIPNFGTDPESRFLFFFKMLFLILFGILVGTWADNPTGRLAVEADDAALTEVKKKLTELEIKGANLEYDIGWVYKDLNKVRSTANSNKDDVKHTKSQVYTLMYKVGRLENHVMHCETGGTEYRIGSEKHGRFHTFQLKRSYKDPQCAVYFTGVNDVDDYRKPVTGHQVMVDECGENFIKTSWIMGLEDPKEMNINVNFLVCGYSKMK